MRKYGLLVLWWPQFDTLDWRVILLALACAFLLLRRHLSISPVLLLASLGGVVLSQLST